jgi:hypothetical protein
VLAAGVFAPVRLAIKPLKKPPLLVDPAPPARPETELVAELAAELAVEVLAELPDPDEELDSEDSLLLELFEPPPPPSAPPESLFFLPNACTVPIFSKKPQRITTRIFLKITS